jgi:hypothetical protein
VRRVSKIKEIQARKPVAENAKSERNEKDESLFEKSQRLVSQSEYEICND